MVVSASGYFVRVSARNDERENAVINVVLWASMAALLCSVECGDDNNCCHNFSPCSRFVMLFSSSIGIILAYYLLVALHGQAGPNRIHTN